VAGTGGHLGSSLGVIELTVALHHVFNAPEDPIIWDVSHQVYPHKILTGRRSRMSTLRQKDGLSGFAKRSESPFDPFGAGHSSTSISAALGECQLCPALPAYHARSPGWPRERGWASSSTAAANVSGARSPAGAAALWLARRVVTAACALCQCWSCRCVQLLSRRHSG
jgi:hypothetical protein